MAEDCSIKVRVGGDDGIIEALTIETAEYKSLYHIGHRYHSHDGQGSLLRLPLLLDGFGRESVALPRASRTRVTKMIAGLENEPAHVLGDDAACHHGESHTDKARFPARNLVREPSGVDGNVQSVYAHIALP